MKKPNLSYIEHYLLTKKSDEIYVSCEKINFIWSENEVKEFYRIYKWLDGKILPRLSPLSEHLNRDKAEILVLSMCIEEIKEYLRDENRSRIFIAMEDSNFIWGKKEVQKFEKLWNVYKKKVKSIKELFWRIGEKLNRDPDEIFLLAIDLKKTQIC